MFEADRIELEGMAAIEKARFEAIADILRKAYEVSDQAALDQISMKGIKNVGSPGKRLGHYQKKGEDFDANRRHIQKTGIQRPKKKIA